MANNSDNWPVETLHVVEDTLSFSEELVLLPKLGEAHFARPGGETAKPLFYKLRATMMAELIQFLIL